MLRVLSLLPILFIGYSAMAQLSADFSANVTSGCEPLVVNFTDLSSGGGTIISREWIFGYGGNTSNNNNPSPSAAYPVAGSYTVTLIVSDGTTTDSITKPNYITVHAKPSPSFSFTPTQGCAPLEVSFTNASTPGSGTITTYQWDFGDGSAFSGQTNPSHTYTSAGIYAPTLKVTNSYGCHKTQGFGNVNVSGGPTAAFTSSNAQACTPPLTVSFTNQSTGVGPMSYAWDLGVTTSTAQNPSATYTSAGFYDVGLTVTDAYGCTDEVDEEDYVGITAVQAAFDVESPICANAPISITNNTVGASNFSWAWGDGTTGSGTSPGKVYSSGGTYTITLTATSGSCNDSYTSTIDVQEVEADFTTSAHYGCEFPHVTTYSDASTVNFGTVDSLIWKLGNKSSNGIYYSEVTIDTSATITRSFSGTYTDTLIVFSGDGCKDVTYKVNNVVLEDLIADFDVDPRRGCAPQQVTFDDTSIPTPSYPIVNWFYDFGNGSTSTSQNTVTNYIDTGCYYPKLIIENAFGCKDSLVINDEGSALCFGAQQSAAASWSIDTTCASDSVYFQDMSSEQQYIDEYIWNFDDDTLGMQGAVTNYPWINYYFNDTGWINLQYIVGQYQCYDTVEYDSVVYVKGPISYFQPMLDCDTPMVRTMNPFLLDVQRWYWDFGDGSPIDSLNEAPVHTYALTGDYTIHLTTYNDSTGCSFSDSNKVAIRDLQVDFGMANHNSLATADSTACAPSYFTFTQDCQDHETGYRWVVQGDTNLLAGGSYTRFFQQTGHHEVALTAWDINGCERTKVREVFLSDPQADFDFSFEPGCDPVTVNFHDTSTSDTNIVSWQWFLGDASGYHYEQHPTHTYSTPGSYQIRLIITDSIGCTDLKQKYLPISFPFVGFYVDTTLCQFTPVNFQNLSNGDNLQFSWDFGNGTTNTALHPTTLYVDTGYFDVSLSLEDSMGCKDTAVVTVHVQNKPVPKLSADTTSSPCLPLPVQFVDSTTSRYVTKWKWTFGDGSASVELDTNVAFHNYTTPGLFDVTLNLETSYGCKGSQERPEYIEVDGPYAAFDVAPDSACKGDRIAFFVTEESRMANYRWVFGDGEDTLVSGAVDTIYHRYTDTVGWRTPVVVYYDSTESCAIPVIDSVYIHAVYARYSFFPDSVGCGRLNTHLINKSAGDDAHMWSFGDGRTSTARSPHIYYPNDGTYNVMLYVENRAIGCKDSLTIPFVVFPEPEVSAWGDTLVCLEDSAWVEAEANSEGLIWQWLPVQGFTTPNAQRSYVAPDTTRYVRAIATDTNGCTGVDSVLVTVQDPPELDILEDTVVIIGEEFQLDPLTPDSLIYRWMPSWAFDCPTCKNPTFKAEESDWYTVHVQDVHGCFERVFEFRVDVEEKYAVDVPDAFTPNGDGVNDHIHVRGWGIKDLQEFRIYNRWGQEVFYSDDLKQGWDGTFKGADQQMDTYAYVVKVKFYDEAEQVLNGFIELIR